MKIVCSKCGIIHDEDFAPCNSTLALPPAVELSKETPEDCASRKHAAETVAEEAPRYQVRQRAMAAAAGAQMAESSSPPRERSEAAVAMSERPALVEETNPPPAPTVDPTPDWRREVTERLETYRARRRRYRPLDLRETPDDSQPMLALGTENLEALRDEAAATEEKSREPLRLAESSESDAPAIERDHENENGDGHGLPIVQFTAVDQQEELEKQPQEKKEEYARRRAALRIAARPRRNDPVEIRVAQPQFDFSVNEAPALHPQDEHRPVAELRERRLAGLTDAVIFGAACAGFFLLFRALGGEFSLSRYSLVACAASAYLVYAQYFVLFTVFTGVTPGMMLRRLDLLTLDGRAPSTRHLLWRSFGYVLSAGAVLLGFLWALWDDDHLTWHDRISQTYLTPAVESAGEELVARPQES